MAPSFAPGCRDPRAAYAVGMVVKMLKTQAQSPPALSDESKPAGDKSSSPKELVAGERDAPVIWQVRLEKLQRVLENPQVEAQEKQGIVDMIEDAVSLQDVWTYLDGVGAFASDGAVATSATMSALSGGRSASGSREQSATRGDAAMSIPVELGCAICCSDLMLKPVSLACGHSFCKYCLELWLTNRSNCPTCRQPTALAQALDAASKQQQQQQQQQTQQTQPQLSVNLALQHVIASFYPTQLRELEKQSQTERFDQLRQAIRVALNSSDVDDLREVLARLPRNNPLSSNASASGNHQDQSLAVSLILESDVDLKERVLAAEIHERLRKERLLRESSRRRHTAAYNTAGLSTQVDPAILHMTNNSTTTVRRGSLSRGTAAGKSSSSLLTSFLGGRKS